MLSDDRICLRPQPDGTVRMYGTPWHGTAANCAPVSATLGGIFFIEHASANRLSPTTGAEAAGRLLALSFVPPFDPLMIANCAAAADVITHAVPCWRLGFVPDATAVEAVLAGIRALR